MKNIIVSILFFLFLTNLYSQQTSWEWQYPNPQGNSLKSVYFVDQMVGWTAGDYGTILKTTDGGFNWSSQNYKSSAFFKSIFFVNQNVGWAVGQDSLKSGIVLKTTNGGSDWMVQLNKAVAISSVYFLNENDGWIFGVDSSDNAPVFKTVDGGNNWDSIYTAPLINHPVSIQFLDENNGWMCGYRMYWITMEGWEYESYLYKTSDGGKNWGVKYDGFPNVLSLKLFDMNHCTAAMRSRTIINTTDGGTTWASYESDNDGKLTGFYSAYFIDDKNGCAFSSDGYAKTTDGGKSWIVNGKSNEVESIFFINDKIGWAVGKFGSIMKTTNGGDSWMDMPKLIKGAIQSIYFLDKNTGWAVGGDYYSNYSSIILSTTDGGINWTNSNLQTDYWIQSIRFADQNNGWMCGNNQFGNGVIFKTTDGGDSWLTQSTGNSDPLYSIFCVDNKYCVAVGYSILFTTDGGTIWHPRIVPTPRYNSVFFVDENNGWIVGNKGIILKVDSVYYMHNQSSGTDKELFSVYFIDKNIGWTVGSRGTIIKTTDGGQTWESQNCSTDSPLRSVYFADINNGWIVGDYGIILVTTDGGNNWNLQQNVTGNNLNSVWFSDNKTGWVGGEGATILKTSNGGITSIQKPISQNIPGSFYIFQNYPNPFNPTTTINYFVAKESFISIKIYDLLGREITTLVNNVKNAGSYEIEFNGSQLSSGIYLYRMQAGNFSETKKLILMK